MTVKKTLIPESKLGRTHWQYTYGVTNPNDTSAVVVDQIDAGVDTERDVVFYARQGVGTMYAGDPFLPLRKVTITPWGDGKAYRTRYYDSRVTVRRSTDTSTLRADVRPTTISAQWYSTGTSWDAAAGSVAVASLNYTVDQTTNTKRIIPYDREFNALHLTIPTELTANPTGSVDGMIGYTNDANFTIDGVTYATKTLLFAGPTVRTLKLPNGNVKYKVIYHYFARQDTWREQVLTAVTLSGGDITAGMIAYRDVYDTTTFTAPPYAG